MGDDLITIQNAKGAKELYLRGLDHGQIEYIKNLQIRFQETRGTEAARRALFGYLDLEKRNKELLESGNKLNQDLLQLKNEFERFKSSVANHFDNEQRVAISKEMLLKVLNPSPIDGKAQDISNTKSFGNHLERRTNAYTHSINS